MSNIPDDNRCVIDYLADYFEEQQQEKAIEDYKQMQQRKKFATRLSILAEELENLVNNEEIFTDQINTIWQVVKKYYEEEN